MTKLAVLFLFYLTYYAVYSSPSDRQSYTTYTDVRTYIDRHGHVGEIRRSTPTEMLDARKRAFNELLMRYFSQRDLSLEEKHQMQKRCKCSCRSRYHRDDWHCCKCTWTQKICFPGFATLRKEDGTKIKMADLKRGDKVLTVDSAGKVVPSEVRAFMQRNMTTMGLYLTLRTSTGHHLTLSKSHLVLTTKSIHLPMSYRFAEDVEVGDYLLVHQNKTTNQVKITDRSHVMAEGAFTPMTEHGTLLVDDVMASCYASFNHQVAHLFMSPLRWLPSVFEPEPHAEGMRNYVRLLRTLGRWILPIGLQNEANWLWDAGLTVKNALAVKLMEMSPF